MSCPLLFTVQRGKREVQVDLRGELVSAQKVLRTAIRSSKPDCPRAPSERDGCCAWNAQKQRCDAFTLGLGVCIVSDELRKKQLDMENETEGRG